MRQQQSRRLSVMPGYSLVEMLVVMAIILILGAIGAVFYTNYMI